MSKLIVMSSIVLMLSMVFVFSVFLFGCLDFLSPYSEGNETVMNNSINETLVNESSDISGDDIEKGINENEEDENQDKPEVTFKEYIITIENCRYTPQKLTANLGDNIKIVAVNKDSVKHGFTIDEYGIKIIIDPGKSETIEFRANKAGTFNYYSQVYSITCPAFGNGKLIV